MNFLKNLLKGFKFAPKLYVAVIAGISAVSVGTASVAGYVSYGYESLPTQIAQVQVIEEEPAAEEEPASEEEMPEEELPEEEEEAEEEDETVELSLNATSIEKDLKVKIQNQNGKVVSGEAFVISLASATEKNAKATEYTDKDKDGIIYIDKLTAGKYTVTLQEIEGYVMKKASITAEVKGKIEYKKVDVTDEIKKESQINTAIEDTAVNNVPVESTMTDTLPLLESKTSASTVEKSDIPAPSMAKASIGSGKSSVTLTRKSSVQAPAEDNKGNQTTDPANPGTTTNPTNPGTEQKPDIPSKDETNPGTETKPDTPSKDETGSGTGTDSGTEQKPDPQPEDKTDSETGQKPDTHPENGAGSGIEANPVEGQGSEPAQQSEPATDEVEQANPAALVQEAMIRNLFAPKTARGALLAAAGTAVPATDQTATAAIPSELTLYSSGSTEYTITLETSGEKSIIQKVEWTISDDSVASLSGTSGESVKATGKKSGSATLKAVITYAADDKGGTAKAELSCKVTVGESAVSDASAPLKDKNGNQLYVDSEGKTEATLADYEKYDKFYTAPKYTGWQTIDGSVYYYDSDHKAVTGNQVIGGVAYSFSDSGKLSQSSGNRGIDVSKYQGNIDWGAVAASGINFAIIRAGYRGSSTGVLVEDPYFKKNISGAAKAGIKVGIYFFTQAISEAEAVEEASMCISLASGYKLTYPIFIDTESASGGRANGLGKSARTAVVNAFCRTVSNAGYKAGVYASKSWYNNQLSASSLSGYCIWVAQYASECTYSGKKDMWQYTSKGKVSGIKGNVDMNISYTGY